jgi:sec-independent protein translocase protein TatC
MSDAPLTVPGSHPEDPQEPEADLKMTIWEHLGELRKRVVRAAIALGIASIVCWNFRERLLALLVVPYEKAWITQKLPGMPELQTLSPADVFVGYMQLSVTGGIILSMPVIFYQLWAFISPGLYAKEKRFIVPFVFFSTTLFSSGVAVAYFIAFPITFGYFFSLLGPVTATGTVLTQRPTLEFYLDFYTRMILAFGFIFELPLFIAFLSFAGIVTPQQLVKFSRWAIILSFIIGAIASPGPEVMSQMLVSGILVGLYFVSILVAFMVARKRPAPGDLESS